jgi:hypothetical protein
MAALNKVFMTTFWENIFLAVSLRALARVGSSHIPLVFDTRASSPPIMKQLL